MCDDEDGEGMRRRPETSPLRGVVKAYTTEQPLGGGAVVMTNRKAATANIEGPGVINDRERRFPLLLLLVATAAADKDVIVEMIMRFTMSCGVYNARLDP